MGALVLQSEKDSDRGFTVIDGQQRLATLSIVAIAVIDRIQTLGEAGHEMDDNQQRQDILKRTYLADKDPRSLTYTSKLRLNENNDDFYQSYLINLRPPRSLRSLSKSNRLLWQAFEYFSRHLMEDVTDIVQRGKSLATFLTDTVAQRLLFIQITVEDELNAYTVFETLNARGIELSSTDLLKNYLFSQFQSRDDLREAQRRWRRIISTVSMEQFPHFLRYYLSLTETRVRRERLFKLIKKDVTDAQKAFDLLDELERYSDLFIALANPEDEFWRDTPNNREPIRELELFGVKQAYPILFAAYEKFTPTDFTALLKLITVLSFRYTVVSSLNPNALESLYNKVAIAIQSGQIATPRQVFGQLQEVYVPDNKFSQDFELLSISTKGKKKLAKYILRKLEQDASDLKVQEDGFSIEHILPENPSEDWQAFFTDEQMEDLVYRIGNLTPLEPSINREIANQSYAVKCSNYPRSKFILAKNIDFDDWTPATLINRQRHLAKRATHIWQSNFYP
jgi:uncharacterized protein with ParB-like and HNH nuclease domain